MFPPASLHPVPRPRPAPRIAAGVVALAAALCAPAAETEFVTVSGDALRAGEGPRAFACAAGADVLVLPCGSDPAAWAPAALAFSAGRAAPAATARRDDGFLDLPGAACARLAVLLEPRGRPGAFVLRLRPDGSEGYVVLARGPGLEKSICEPAPDAEPVPVSPGGFFRVNGISGPAVILFRPPAPGASLLRGI